VVGTQIAELQEVFATLAGSYTSDGVAVQRAWRVIENHHTERGRHYHNLAHLADIIDQLLPFKENQGWDVLLFTAFYHDIMYNVLRHDNEEQSAELAVKEMALLYVPQTLVEATRACILATKTHESTGDGITDLFIDADMSIVGRDWDTYIIYAQNVRKEYGIYPDLLYNPGRKKALGHFLSMDRIFKTAYFYDKYEVRARENVFREMA
jgi:predicted metal-dependent HD superfamily phosphohydrolase